jgi:hypothetical protein
MLKAPQGQPLRLQRVLLLGVGSVALVLALWWIGTTLFDRPQPVDPQQIRQAVQTFCQERRALGIALPPTVSLRELVEKGYLRPEDIRGFGSAEIVFSLKIDNQKPGSVLMEARMPDGSRVGAFSDGTLQPLEPPATNR